MDLANCINWLHNWAPHACREMVVGMSFIPPELMDWLSAVVKRLDIQIDAERGMILELKAIKLELRELNAGYREFKAEKERLEGKRT